MKYCFSMNYRKIIIFLLFLLHACLTFSQVRISSPYSRYGLGDIYSNAGLRNQAMGGVVASDYTGSSINFRNPASLTAVDSLSFLFDGAIQSNFSTLSTSTQSQKSNYASLDYLAFAFPLSKRISASFGLLPYSHVGYKISLFEKSDIIGNTKFTSEGNGGINSFYGALAVELAPWISLGLNASYLFGSIDKTRWLSFPDSSYYYSIRERNSMLVSDFLLSGGLHLRPKIGKYQINTGLTFNMPTKISITADSIGFTYLETSTSSEIKDTFNNVSGKQGIIELPMGIAFGLGFSEGKKWMLAADVNYQKWSDFTTSGIRDTLGNSLRLGLGGEFTPNNIRYTLNSNYFRRITYRGGVFYGTSFLEFKGKPLTEYGISFGVGLPLRGSLNQLNLTGAYLVRGSQNDGLLKQEILQISVGVSVNERWFFKRKID